MEKELVSGDDTGLARKEDGGFEDKDGDTDGGIEDKDW